MEVILHLKSIKIIIKFNQRELNFKKGQEIHQIRQDEKQYGKG